MPTLDVPGGSLDYETDGHISRPAVLLIGGTVRQWDSLAETLGRTHFVVRWTHSTGAEDVRDAVHLLDHLGVESAAAVVSREAGELVARGAGEHPSRIPVGLVVDLSEVDDDDVLAWLTLNGR